MADFTFLHVFGLSMVVTTLRVTMFSPSSLLKTLFGQATGGSKPEKSPITALMEGLKVAQQKIAETNPEAAAALEKVTGAPKMPRRLTKELKEYESAQSEVEKMKKESA